MSAGANGSAEILLSQAHRDVLRALEIARLMTQIGIPVFTAEPTTVNDLGFLLPDKWQQTRPNKYVVDQWRPGMALCAVGGVKCDFIDVDPRNDGLAGVAFAQAAGGFPYSYGKASTPSGGYHEVVAPLGIGSTKKMGIDLKGGKPDGTGRGFVFIAPTVRRSKVDGIPGPYEWVDVPDLRWLVQFDDDDTGQHFRDWITQKERSDSPSGIGESVYTGGFYIDAKHTGRIPPGMGHDALISLCGYLLKKYPDISWTDYKGLCYARWQEFDQSQFTWEWREAEYQIQKCWDTFERGKMFDEWMKTQNPFQGLISNPTAKPFTGTITDPTARPYIEAGR